MNIGNWVTFRQDIQSPYVRGTFDVDDLVSAKITICGLGFFELFLNGRRCGDYFKPVWTDYEPRDLSTLYYPNDAQFTHRVCFAAYDITPYLTSGENCVAVVLGNGWYRQDQKNCEGELCYNRHLKLNYAIEWTDGAGVTHTEKSGAGLAYKRGHIVYNNVYFGEKHDYSLYDTDWMQPGYRGEGWTAAAPTEGPDAVYELQQCPNDTIAKTIRPTRIAERGGVSVYDAGESLSGWVRFTAAGEGGVKVRYAEHIHGDRTLDFRPTLLYDRVGGEGRCSGDEYVGLHAGVVCRPVFCWHGFRYFEIEGAYTDLVCESVHADIPRLAEFQSDSAALNWYFEASLNTFYANMHCGVPSDCPHREKMGYTGDGQLIAESVMLTTDSRTFFKKWMRDIADCQDLKTGHVQHTAPFYGGGGGPGGWGIAIVKVPLAYYGLYGDKEPLQEYFPNMLRFIESFGRFTEDGLVVRELPGGWCLGEWCAPEKTVIPEPYVNTCLYIKAMQLVEGAAAALGRAVSFRDRIETAKRAVAGRYYEAETNSFCGDVQGADLFALDIGMGGGTLLKKTFAKYERLRKFDTGIFGTDILLELLARHGRADIMYALLTSSEYPSFGHMRKNGAKTLYETWEGRDSHCHPMFGAGVRRLFDTILGIKQRGAGFGKVTIEPPDIAIERRLYGRLKTADGVIEVRYDTDENGFFAEVSLTGGICAELLYKGRTFRLNHGANRVTLEPKKRVAV
ncbi:MAG: family 78 glycoside hydrolase catalytic domain [Clostridiales bacterium]|jgi:alpha-L-rhamnosidase|nr:family 78 glycoside hydrolase catalytic domain [Clostridiales bacterium]